jgi:hypothetical protein
LRQEEARDIEIRLKLKELAVATTILLLVDSKGF